MLSNLPKVTQLSNSKARILNPGSQVVVVMLSCLVMSDSLQPPGLEPTRLLSEILYARILEWVAVSVSRGSSQPRD